MSDHEQPTRDDLASALAKATEQVIIKNARIKKLESIVDDVIHGMYADEGQPAFAAQKEVDRLLRTTGDDA